MFNILLSPFFDAVILTFLEQSIKIWSFNTVFSFSQNLLRYRSNLLYKVYKKSYYLLNSNDPTIKEAINFLIKNPIEKIRTDTGTNQGIKFREEWDRKEEPIVVNGDCFLTSVNFTENRKKKLKNQDKDDDPAMMSI
jgi:hypothetical protein